MSAAKQYKPGDRVEIVGIYKWTTYGKTHNIVAHKPAEVNSGTVIRADTSRRYPYYLIAIDAPGVGEIYLRPKYLKKESRA